MLASDEEGTMDPERSPLLTDEQLEKLAALASALRSIVGNHQPHLRDNLSDEIDRLRTMIAENRPREEIQALAEKLDSETLMEWAEAIHDGERVLDELTLKLADASAEDDDSDN
jgi:hypothetical protein